MLSTPLPKISMTQDGMAQEAYELLGITEMDVLSVPRITPILEQCGVLKRVWDCIEASGTSESQSLLFARRKLDAAHTRAIPLEAFCVAAKVPTSACVAMVNEVLKIQSSMLRNSRAFDKLAVKSKDESIDPMSAQPTELLPPIEDDVRAISDRFNQRFVTAAPVIAEIEEEDDADTDD